MIHTQIVHAIAFSVLEVICYRSGVICHRVVTYLIRNMVICYFVKNTNYILASQDNGAKMNRQSRRKESLQDRAVAPQHLPNGLYLVTIVNGTKSKFEGSVTGSTHLLFISLIVNKWFEYNPIAFVNLTVVFKRHATIFYDFRT